MALLRKATARKRTLAAPEKMRLFHDITGLDRHDVLTTSIRDRGWQPASWPDNGIPSSATRIERTRKDNGCALRTAMV